MAPTSNLRKLTIEELLSIHSLYIFFQNANQTTLPETNFPPPRKQNFEADGHKKYLLARAR